MKIAVSYRRVDESPTFDLLVEALIDRFGKENVYSDVESTKLGEDWLLRWSSSYVSADCILIVIGPNWNPDHAEDQHRIREAQDWIGRPSGNRQWLVHWTYLSVLNPLRWLSRLHGGRKPCGRSKIPCRRS